MHSVVLLEPWVHGVLILEAEVWLHDESVVQGDGEAHHVQLDVWPGGVGAYHPCKSHQNGLMSPTDERY